MHPDAPCLWRAPRWAFAILMAILGMLGPFSIDTYLPAFSAIAQTTGATPVQMQQTLSAYLFGFAFMNLFHGALSDSLGRRPVVLTGLAVFTLASVGCALSQSIGQLIFFRALQGFSTGAGIVVSRAMIRDLYPPRDAQKLMSQVTIFFGIAPAIAPMIGGVLLTMGSWHLIFYFLVAVGLALLAVGWRWLPESLHPGQRQPFDAPTLFRGYRQLLADPRFLLLAFASGVPFNGMFLYVLSAPAFLGEVLGLAPQRFFWFFIVTIGGIMTGSVISGRMAGRVAPRRQIRIGFVIMVLVSVLNVAANGLWQAQAWWALWPVALFSMGWALMVPAVTLLALDLYPARRGMASSLQAVVGSAANGVVAGALAPLVMHSALGLAVMSTALMSVGLICWALLRWRWPHIGQTLAH